MRDARGFALSQIWQGVPTGRPDAGLHGRACHDRLSRHTINAATARRFHLDIAIFSDAAPGGGGREGLPWQLQGWCLLHNGSAIRGKTTTARHRAARSRAEIELAFRAWPGLQCEALSHGTFKELRHRAVSPFYSACQRDHGYPLGPPLVFAWKICTRFFVASALGRGILAQ